ncbi:MAG: hypothetical protein JXB48_09370 [Candidatus Latescibacteria bacterium]|nr:hypothetical protein [Candidatus Latescibacterota bacterium]
MDTHVNTIKQTVQLIQEVKSNFDIEITDSRDPQVFAGVVYSDILEKITPLVEKYFGPASKPAGKSAFITNLTDRFAKAIGGIRKEQTVFRKNVSSTLDLYCAFWPWGSNPVKTTVRIGVLGDLQENENEICALLK